MAHALGSPRSRSALLVWAPLGLASAVALCSAIAGAEDTIRNPATNRVVRNETRREAIPHASVVRPGRDMTAGASKTIQRGRNGERLVTYRVVLEGGRERSRDAISSRVVRRPVPEITMIGGRGRYPSRGGYASGRRVLTMVATGYDPLPAGSQMTGRTATGLKAGHGVVAVDPSFIPLGTRLYIEGYGYAIAADIGGSIRGNRIDLGHDTRKRAMAVGRRLVRVHILD
ncbi:MAG TPA: 3D domain-containing protein [Chthonomonadales bacterium]|nr:3D domain-containing protein [Chthonomonadales bacterium]